MPSHLAHDALISPEEYLAGELRSDVKHEYLSGIVYAMAGATNVHNQIAGNVFAALHNRLRGKPCRPYNADTKVRLRLRDQWRFYYPDAQVTCHPNPPGDSFQDQPVVIVEVISESTRRADEGEKRDGYLALSSVEQYLLIEQDRAFVILWRRTSGGFVREALSGLESTVLLSLLGVELPLSEIYEEVALPPAAIAS